MRSCDSIQITGGYFALHDNMAVAITLLSVSHEHTILGEQFCNWASGTPRNAAHWIFLLALGGGSNNFSATCLASPSQAMAIACQFMEDCRFARDSWNCKFQHLRLYRFAVHNGD